MIVLCSIVAGYLVCSYLVNMFLSSFFSITRDNFCC